MATLDGTPEGYRAFVNSLPPTVVAHRPLEIALAPTAEPAAAPRPSVDPQAARLAAQKPRMHRTFEAAVMTRLSSDWTFSPLSADAEIRQNFRNLRARSRDLERNDSYGEHYLALAEQNVIGAAGIGLQMKVRGPSRPREGDGKLVETLDTPVNTTIEKAWKRQCKRRNFTVGRDLSATAADKLILRTMLRDGDLLIRKVRGYPNEFAFAIQILEGDYLDETYTDFRAVACQCPSQFGLPLCQNGTHEIRMGVELQGDWKFPVAYWLLSAHPGDYMVGTAVYAEARIRVPVDEIIHPFIKKRPGQTRGYPAIACAMLRLHMLGGYAEAELVAARAGAQKMGFIESSVPESLFDQYYDPDTQMAEINGEPGEIEELPMGKTFKEWDPTHPNGNFGPFNKEQLRGVAAGLNVSYTSLSGNIEDVNFSSMRGGLLEEREGWKGLQTFFIDEVKQEIFEAWLEMSILSGRINLPMSRWDDYTDEDAVVWKPRRWPWVDPLKDIQAKKLAVDNNFETKASAIAENGGDLEDVLEERAYETSLEKELDIQPVDQQPPPASAEDPEDDEEEESDDKDSSAQKKSNTRTFAGDAEMLAEIIEAIPAERLLYDGDGVLRGWVTINGAHVLIEDGLVTKGPAGLAHHFFKKKLGGDPSGGHISDALQVKAAGPHAAEIHHALVQISKVHGGGSALPTIPIEADPSLATGTSVAQYEFSGTQSKRIALLPDARHTGLDLTHEIGHFLDHQGLGTNGHGDATLTNHSSVHQVLAAIQRGKGTQELDRLANVAQGRTDATSEYERYAAQPDEKFARAYSQYIAHRSQDPTLLAQLHDLRSGSYGAELFHTDQEFEPIAKAFDRLFKSKGWR